MFCLKQEVIKVERSNIESKFLPELHPRVAHLYAHRRIVTAEIWPEIGRNGLQRDWSCEYGCLCVVFSVGLRTICFKGLTFEPRHRACFEIFVRTVFERVADECEADQIMGVRTEDGSSKVVCMAT